MMTPSTLGAESGQTLLDGSSRWKSERSTSMTRRDPVMFGPWLILPCLEVSVKGEVVHKVDGIAQPTTELVLSVCHRHANRGLGHRICLATLLDDAALTASITANNSDGD